MSNPNLDGLALDAFYAALPDDPYAPCPCGCGKKVKFVLESDLEHARALQQKERQTCPSPTQE
jgi:hypothetical protein